MPSSSLVHWLVLIVAAGVALGGIYVVGRALFADRSRGRRRCPRCWYEMTGVAGLKCPECGREARRERRLFRTRRRYRRAVLGVLLVLLSISLAFGEEAYEKGWVKAVPTVGYVAALPWMAPGSRGWKELETRILHGEVHRWEYELLVRRLLRVIPDDSNPPRTIGLMRMLVQVDAIGQAERTRRPYLSWVRLSEISPREPAMVLGRMLGSTNFEVRHEALSAMRVIRADAWVALPSLYRFATVAEPSELGDVSSCIESIRTPEFDSYSLARPQPATTDELFVIAQIFKAAPDGEFPVQGLVGALDDSNPEVRSRAAWLLALFAGDNEAARSAMLDRFETGGIALRESILRNLSMRPVDVKVRAVLHVSLQRSERILALRAIARLGEDGATFRDDIRQILEDAVKTPGWYPADFVIGAARTWVSIGGDPKVPLGAIRKLLTPGDWPNDWEFMLEYAECLSWLGGSAPELLPELQRVMDGESTSYSVEKAIEVYWLVGGDPVRATRALQALYGWEKMLDWVSLPEFLGRVASTSPEVSKLLAESLDDPDPRHRRAVCDVLAQAGASAAVALPRLRELRTDADPLVADAADVAVRTIEWKRAHPEEAERLRKEKGRWRY